MPPPTNRLHDEPANPPGREMPDFELIELLYFAYRDFVGEADQTLARFNFGRAHHRVLYFVDRRPGMTVAELLETLRITKQSLARVLKQLVDDGYIEQAPGRQDRRQRLLHTSEKGRELVYRLGIDQSHRISEALSGLRHEARADVVHFLSHMVSPRGTELMHAFDPGDWTGPDD